MASKKQPSKATESKGFNYFKFIGHLITGRPLICSKYEFFAFHIVSWIVFFVAIMIGNALGSSIDLTPLSWLVILVAVIYVVISFLAMVGRLHDVGYSGWLMLLSAIPFANFILLIFMFLPSDGAVEKGKTNKYRQ